MCFDAEIEILARSTRRTVVARTNTRVANNLKTSTWHTENITHWSLLVVEASIEEDRVQSMQTRLLTAAQLPTGRGCTGFNCPN
jgi:hypothetical protein